MNELEWQLLAAADRGDLGAIEDLCAQQASPNCRDQHCNTPLSNAVWKGNIDAIELLVQHGADLNQSCYENNSLLSHAAFNAQVVSVAWLLAHGADPNRCAQDTGESALHFVISKTDDLDRTTIVRRLVAAGADVNAQTIPGRATGCFMREAFAKGETPLHRAAAFGDEAMIRTLLDAGADPSRKDANGDTPISWASWHLRPLSIVGLLLYGDVPGWHGCPNPNLKGADLR